jgi:hypothetical protein
MDRESVNMGRFSKTAKTYGKAFWTKRGKYGRYVYRFGRRVAFEELARYARKQSRKKWNK